MSPVHSFQDSNVLAACNYYYYFPIVSLMPYMLHVKFENRTWRPIIIGLCRMFDLRNGLVGVSVVGVKTHCFMLLT